MLDLIQDQSVREIHDVIRQSYARAYGEGSIPLRVFDLSVQSFLEEGDDLGLESFLQIQWDELNIN